MRKASVRWCIAVMLSCAELGGGAIGAAQADTVKPESAQNVFQQAHQALGNGGTYTSASCAIGVPLLDRAIALAQAELRSAALPSNSALTSARGILSYGQLARGYCALVAGEDVQAVALFQSAITYDEQGSGSSRIASDARACLAYAYTKGRGVVADPILALGYYTLSEQSRCTPVADTAAADAAAIVRTLDPFAVERGDSAFYRFLKTGTSRDWGQAVDVYADTIGRNTGPSDIMIAMAIEGLNAPGDTPEDRAARLGLNLWLGKWHLVRERRTIALGYFQSADLAAAQPFLSKIIAEAPYRLMVQAGVMTGIPDAQ